MYPSVYDHFNALRSLLYVPVSVRPFQCLYIRSLLYEPVSVNRRLLYVPVSVRPFQCLAEVYCMYQSVNDYFTGSS